MPVGAAAPDGAGGGWGKGVQPGPEQGRGGRRPNGQVRAGPGRQQGCWGCWRSGGGGWSGGCCGGGGGLRGAGGGRVRPLRRGHVQRASAARPMTCPGGSRGGRRERRRCCCWSAVGQGVVHTVREVTEQAGSVPIIECLHVHGGHAQGRVGGGTGMACRGLAHVGGS